MNNYLDKNIENFLKNIDHIDLIRKIFDFRKLNIKNMESGEISKKIMDVLCFNQRFCYIPQIRHYPKDTKFFRVRKLEGTTVPLKNLSYLSDFWNPPSGRIKTYQRLNKPNESLLYTSLINPFVAIGEMKIKKDEFYALIVYSAKDIVKVNCIGAEYNYENIKIVDKQAILANELINNFFIDEFCRDVGIGTEYLYKVSEVIAKDYFDLPPKVAQDAWLYPSVQNKTMYNVCFRPEIAKELLKLDGAIIGKYENNEEIKAVCVTHGFDDKGYAMLYEIGSDVQKEIFPEIKKN